MRKRVVITGMGVVAPNAIGVPAFYEALRAGESGLRHDPQLEQLKFGCQVAGEPQLDEATIAKYFTPLQLRSMKASGLVYGVIAGKEAFAMAGFEPAPPDRAHTRIGCIFGTGQSGSEKFREAIHLIDDGRVRRLGSTSVIQTMASGISAWLAGELGLGDWVTSNSSACCTGTEAVLMGYNHIASGAADVMLVGSTSDSGPYIWGGFDAMRVLPTAYNDNPTAASRPMDEHSKGFVPGSGSGALVLESLENAQARGAKILAEVKGGAMNCGGQRGDGSMTAPHGAAVQACIRQALENAQVTAQEITAINGHLTATVKDAYEVENWTHALQLEKSELPYLNSFKGAIGHCLAAAGSVELVGSILQLQHNEVFPNVNLQNPQQAITDLWPVEKLPTQLVDCEQQVVVKASFGFGDVNAVVVVGQIE